MKLFAVFKWAILLLLLACALVGASGLWLWQNSDRLLRQKVEAGFQLALPDLELHIGTARLTGGSTLRLGSVEIRDRATDRAWLRAKELIAIVEPSELIERQRLVLKSIQLSHADVLAIRKVDGRWNWQDVRFVRTEGSQTPPLPLIILEDVRTQLELHHSSNLPPSGLILNTDAFQAVPKSAVSYVFDGDLGLRETASAKLTGELDINTGYWKLDARARNIQIGQKLVDVASKTAPRIQQTMARLDGMVQRLIPESSETPPGKSSALLIGTSPYSPRFLAVADLSISLQGNPKTPVPDFRLFIDMRDGQFTTYVLNDILTDVRAKLFCDNRQAILRIDEARDGDARISGEVKIDRTENAGAAVATLHVEDFHVDRRITRFLSPRAELFFDHFQPDGNLSGDVQLEQLPGGRWIPTSLNAKVTAGKAIFHKFRHPVTEITGTIVQRPFGEGERSPGNLILDMDLEGVVAGRPLSITGSVRNPGPEAEMRFTVGVTELPIDSRFRDALEPPGRKVLDSLDLTGTGNAHLECYRAPGLNNRIEMVLNAEVMNSAMRFRGFPISIKKLNGKLQYDTRNKLWTFEDLAGEHSDGQLSAHGTYRGSPLPGVLELEVTAKNTALSSELQSALSPSHQKLWEILEPSGRLNLITKIHWTAQPGQKPVVQLPMVELFDAEIYPRPFPYRMQVSSLRMTFDPNDPQNGGAQHCEILSLSAEHDGAPINAKGWAEVTSDEQWIVHLNDLSARDLAPDDDLRVALPDSWRQMMGRLSQSGRVSIEGSELEFRGQTNGTVSPTAAWNMNLRLRDCGVAAGLDLQKVSGLVTAQGTWDGVHLSNTGDIRLDSVLVRGMTLTEIAGNYVMDEEELLLGSRDIFQKQISPQNVPEDAQLRGRAYGGTLLLNALIDLRSGQGYQLFGQINKASLQSYAARHISGQPDLAGNVNAWLYLTGAPDSQDSMEGEGQMQISPASLYELPLMLELLGALSKLNFIVRERSAFNYALLNFKVQDRAFWFNPIDLVGETLAMRGRGRVGFSGDVKLDFYSQPGKSGPRSIPLVKELVFATSTQWVGVKVTGTIDHPQTEIRPRQQMDESLRQLLNQFQPNPDGPTPGLVIPGIFNVRPFQQATRNP